MSRVPLRGNVSVMARTNARPPRKPRTLSSPDNNPRLVSAPFAVTSDGEIVLSVGQLDGVTDLASAMRALEHQGDVFIGLVLSDDDVTDLKERLGHGMREAAASLAYRRQRQS